MKTIIRIEITPRLKSKPHNTLAIKDHVEELLNGKRNTTALSEWGDIQTYVHQEGTAAEIFTR